MLLSLLPLELQQLENAGQLTIVCDYQNLTMKLIKHFTLQCISLNQSCGHASLDVKTHLICRVCVCVFSFTWFRDVWLMKSVHTLSTVVYAWSMPLPFMKPTNNIFTHSIVRSSRNLLQMVASGIMHPCSWPILSIANEWTDFHHMNSVISTNAALHIWFYRLLISDLWKWSVKDRLQHDGNSKP